MVHAGADAADKSFIKRLHSNKTFGVKDWTVAGAEPSAFVGEKVTIEL